jgi:hypothetical protein
MAISRQRITPRGIVLRINILLGAADGTANRVLARKLSTSVPTGLLWRRRYENDGLPGILAGWALTSLYFQCRPPSKKRLTSCPNTGVHYAGHFANNLADAVRNSGNNRTGSDRHKTGHQSIFDRIPSVIVPPNAQPRDRDTWA